jgi:hypothetical protein
MKKLAEILEAADPAALRGIVIRQLRGENPAGLRQIYETAHYPIAAIYRSLTGRTRESLQNVVYELVRETAAAKKPAVPPDEVFALVMPLFAADPEGDVRTLLLDAAASVNGRPALRQPVLLALARLGYRGTAAFWRAHLRGSDDEALAVILAGVARASLSEFFGLLRALEWSVYVADCVATLTPWLIEEHGAEAVLPRLLRILRDIPPDLGRPILAVIDPLGVPMPRRIPDWTTAIESYALGETDETPWQIFEIDASPRTERIAAEKGDFQLALDDWIRRWSPHPDSLDRAMREIELLRRHPSQSAIVAIIGALDTFRLQRAGHEHVGFIAAALSVITMNQAIVRNVWRESQETRNVYERWLEHALGVEWMRPVVLRELVKWLDLPDLAPFYALIAHGQMTVAELIHFARNEAADEAVVVRMVHEVHQFAQLAGRPEIIKAIETVDPTFALKFLKRQQLQFSGSAIALSDNVNRKLREIGT